MGVNKKVAISILVRDGATGSPLDAFSMVTTVGDQPAEVLLPVNAVGVTVKVRVDG